MRNLELVIPIFKTKTNVTSLKPKEKRIIINLGKKNNDFTIVLAQSNHLKFNSISSIQTEPIVLNAEGFDSFWIERSTIGLHDKIKLTVE